MRRRNCLDDESIVVLANERMGSAPRGNELMLLSIPNGRFYSLNPVGARLWKLLESPIRMRDLYSLVQREFDVAPDDCRTDVTAFVSQMMAEGLVVMVPDERAPNTT